MDDSRGREASNGWSAAGGAFMVVAGAVAYGLWGDAGHSLWQLAFAVVATIGACAGFYWMIAALIPLRPFSLGGARTRTGSAETVITAEPGASTQTVTTSEPGGSSTETVTTAGPGASPETVTPTGGTPAIGPIGDAEFERLMRENGGA